MFLALSSSSSSAAPAQAGTFANTPKTRLERYLVFSRASQELFARGASEELGTRHSAGPVPRCHGNATRVVNAYDLGKCTGPYKCQGAQGRQPPGENLQEYGPESWDPEMNNNFPHGQWVGKNVYPKASTSAAWYSLPGKRLGMPQPPRGRCSSKKFWDQQGDCVNNEPSGACPLGVVPTGEWTCTYTYQKVGELKISRFGSHESVFPCEIENITSFETLIEGRGLRVSGRLRGGGREYDKKTDKGVHLHFWASRIEEDNIDSKTACQARVDHVQRMFEKPPGPFYPYYPAGTFTRPDSDAANTDASDSVNNTGDSAGEEAGDDGNSTIVTKLLSRRREAFPADSDKRFELAVLQAGPDAASLGDCPFTHSVQMALCLKGVDYEVVPCVQETKPSWLLEECGGKMPCVCHKGEPHVETSEILAWIDCEFPTPSLQPPADLPEKVKGCGLFPAIAGFTKNTDAAKDPELRAKLESSLAQLGKLLEQWGETMTLLDCDLLPKLYVMSVATAQYKNFGLEDVKEGGEVIRAYFSKGSSTAEFSRGDVPLGLGPGSTLRLASASLPIKAFGSQLRVARGHSEGPVVHERPLEQTSQLYRRIFGLRTKGLGVARATVPEAKGGLILGPLGLVCLGVNGGVWRRCHTIARAQERGLNRTRAYLTRNCTAPAVFLGSASAEGPPSVLVDKGSSQTHSPRAVLRVLRVSSPAQSGTAALRKHHWAIFLNWVEKERTNSVEALSLSTSQFEFTEVAGRCSATVQRAGSDLHCCEGCGIEEMRLAHAATSGRYLWEVNAASNPPAAACGWPAMRGMGLLLKLATRTSTRSFGALASNILGRRAKILVDCCLILTQYGFAIADIIFIVENVRDVVCVETAQAACPSRAAVCAGTLICVLPVTWLRSLQVLTVPVLMSNVVLLCGISWVYYCCFVQLGLHGISPNVILFNWAEFPVFFGCAVFSFEGVGLILPIQFAMQQPTQFPKILRRAMFILGSLFASFGMFGYAAYGLDTKDMITFNIPQNKITSFLRLFYCLGIFFTYPVMLFPLYQITEAKIRCLRDQRFCWRRIIFRTTLVIMTGVIGLQIPHFGLFLGIIGSLACSALAFVLPALLHFKRLDRNDASRGGDLKDLSIITFGVYTANWASSFLELLPGEAFACDALFLVACDAPIL
ncbi:unnamed protein product [Effrenium voratum]|uniref:Amino acid transporter transmembrane domain-containing protein n=1 Tax=Effrenium voratum TaxID=2562239 RepID=A0AA36JMH2_9DINO|nr:unnamed protein product [Effrenium voratum]